MKKMIALVALVTLTLASCQKSYECECTSATNLNTTTESHKGSDAADACSDATSVLEMKVCTPKQ
jgi:hypothetical protein